MTTILHITTRGEWEMARTAREYRAPSLDNEGFIHCSTAAQAVKVANAFYAGQDNLVLLCIEIGKLRAQVKWEDPAHPAPNAPIGIKLSPSIDQQTVGGGVFDTFILRRMTQKCRCNTF